jgi:hypothetical protein
LLDIDDNFFKRAPDDVLVHRYKGDKQPVNLINSASNEMVAKESVPPLQEKLSKGRPCLDVKYFEQLSLDCFLKNAFLI